MPEGDTIFRAARTLHRALAGHVVTRFDTQYAPLARVHDDAPITGHTVDKVEARGKHVLMWFSGSHYEYDAAIPTLTQVVGHDHGDEVTSPEEITTYLRALAAAAPARTRLVEYGRTWEGRPLHLLAIATPARIAQLDAITQDLRRLADPRTLSATETAALITRLDLAKAIEPIRELPTLVPGAIAPPALTPNTG